MAGAVEPGDPGRRFEDLLAELEAVTDRLAGGEIGIEEATDLYEHASRLHREASDRLEAVRARVEQLRDPTATGPA
ncbi:MAG TPA: exodeoxyribonuclease VII small subunit [Acidimicrobiales bacterium]|nr:exodeoxyribonuclease VII small subunit [Acidimicrobiales bacterium]